MRTTLALLFAFCATFAFGQEEIKQRYVEVTGESKIEVTPDIAYFSIVIRQTKNENINIDKQEQDIIKVLNNHKVAPENLTIDKISGIRQKVNMWGSHDVLAQKSFILKLTDLSQVDAILNEISALKVNSISLRKLENSQIEKYKLDACKLAAQNAVEKASYLAQGLNSTLLAPLSLFEQDLSVSGNEEELRPRYMLKMSSVAMDTNAGEDDGAQQDFKNIIVRCSVRAKIEISK